MFSTPHDVQGLPTWGFVRLRKKVCLYSTLSSEVLLDLERSPDWEPLPESQRKKNAPGIVTLNLGCCRWQTEVDPTTLTLSGPNTETSAFTLAFTTRNMSYIQIMRNFNEDINLNFEICYLPPAVVPCVPADIAISVVFGFSLSGYQDHLRGAAAAILFSLQTTRSTFGFTHHSIASRMQLQVARKKINHWMEVSTIAGPYNI